MRENKFYSAALSCQQEGTMLDLRVIAASLAVMVALMSVVLAEPTKDQTPVAS